MNFEIVTKKSFKVCGLEVELTTSQQENYRIIRKHWQNFNNELRLKKIKSGKNWQKFGITTKKNNQYSYLSAIPSNSDVLGFKTFNISQGKFACFCHIGSMELMKSTFHKIYKEVIPMSDIKIDEKRFFLHYEQYDYRFHWNKTDSVIEIFVPIVYENKS